MTLRIRAAAAGTAILLAAGSSLLIASPASAADFYVDDSDLSATETSPYPSGWFRGTVSGTPGSYTTTLSGLDVTGGDFQALYGVEGTIPAGQGLDESASDFVAPDITVSAGAAAFQIPIFTTGDAGYTTLYADAAGIEGDVWYSSQNYGTIVADTPYSLADLVAEMETDYLILAFGVFVNAEEPATIVSLDWAGDTYWFLPAAPTVTMSATEITEDEFAETGVTMTATGFVPGETVDTGYGGGSFGDSLGTVVADENGVVIVTLPSSIVVVEGGTYTLGANGESGVSASGSFDVVAAEEELADTGAAETTALIALGGGLLLAGATALVLASRRSASQR